MKKKLIILQIFSLFIFSSCIQDDSSRCSDFNIINSKKIEKLGQYHSKVSFWGDDGRMDFIRRFYDPLSEHFELIHNQIKLNDKKSFSESKLKTSELIKSFIRWTQLERWKNNEYFWIFRNCLSDLTDLKLSTADGCINDELYQCLEIENDLFPTLYLMGYNDQYCFNKIEPISIATSYEDSTAITSGVIGYDSTQPYDVVYWLNNESAVPTDSVYGDMIFVKGNRGKNVITGIHRFNQRGQLEEASWITEFIVK